MAITPEQFAHVKDFNLGRLAGRDEVINILSNYNCRGALRKTLDKLARNIIEAQVKLRVAMAQAEREQAEREQAE